MIKLTQLVHEIIQEKKKSAKGPCWKGYEQIGTKLKNGREVPNCVPKKRKSK